MILIKNVSKIYGKKESSFSALKNVNFTIPNNSSVAIIGKSGSGKSTLMHIMSGLDHPTKGTVNIDGKNINALKDSDKDKFRSQKMGFIFQSFFVEANQTTYQNVILPLEISKVKGNKKKTLATNALKAVELSDKADTLAGKLSGGQKQRLAIARAVVNNPSIIFADEPTGNLDSVTGERVIDLLFKLNNKIGGILVVVTHDQELASRCQRQIILKDGVVESIKVKSRRGKI